MPDVRPFRCFDSRILFTSISSATAIILLALLRVHLGKDSGLELPIAILQTGAYAMIVITMLRSIGSVDELERQIHYEAITIAAAGVLIVLGSWGFFSHAGLPALDWAPVSLPLFTFLWVGSVRWISRRYR